MFNRLSAVLLVLGALAGYALSGPVATAQIGAPSPVPPFVAAGDEVTLYFERGAIPEGAYSIRCTVAEIQGLWIRCAGDKFAASPERRWYSVQRVIQIVERER